MSRLCQAYRWTIVILNAYPTSRNLSYICSFLMFGVWVARGK
jgi:hypothetical protein